MGLQGEHAVLTLDREGRDLEVADQLVLETGGVLADERVALAPLTGGADLRHWFDTVLVGHFVAGFILAC